MKVYLIKNITNKDVKYKNLIIKPNTIHVYSEPRLDGVLMLLEKRNLITIEYNDNFHMYDKNVGNDGANVNTKPIPKDTQKKKGHLNTKIKTEKNI